MNAFIVGECFIVRPERSEDHRRIGAQSAMCLLHVSQWGLTLALQVWSHCLTSTGFNNILIIQSLQFLETGNNSYDGNSLDAVTAAADDDYDDSADGWYHGSNNNDCYYDSVIELVF